MKTKSYYKLSTLFLSAILIWMWYSKTECENNVAVKYEQQIELPNASTYADVWAICNSQTELNELEQLIIAMLQIDKTGEEFVQEVHELFKSSSLIQPYQVSFPEWDMKFDETTKIN